MQITYFFFYISVEKREIFHISFKVIQNKSRPVQGGFRKSLYFTLNSATL